MASSGQIPYEQFDCEDGKEDLAKIEKGRIEQFDCEDQHDVLPENEIVKKPRSKKVKYQLIDYDSLPAFLRDNDYILKYYRSEWPLKQVLLSTFTIHNETLNIWTHLIGFILFLFLTIYTATKIPHNSLPDILKNADIHMIQSKLVKCLPSSPNMPDFSRLKDELKATSLHSIHSLSSTISQWHVVEYISNCLPHRHSANHIGDHTLWNMKEDIIKAMIPLTYHPITRWPFFAFLGGAMFCLLASSTCHLLSCHSERLSYIMLRLDYAGIAALITTSFYPPVYYSFMCNPFFKNLYLTTITILGICTIVVSLLPVFQKPEFRKIRASLFFGMGVSGAAPILHKVIIYWHQPEALQTTGLELLMGSLYGVGALIYATRVPERWRPGKFDIAGQSHQLFHILVVAGAYTHYHAGLIYLKWRDLHGC